MLGQRHHAVVAVPQKTKAGFYFVYKKGGGGYVGTVLCTHSKQKTTACVTHFAQGARRRHGSVFSGH